MALEAGSGVIVALIGAGASIMVATLAWITRLMAHVYSRHRQKQELIRALHSEVSDKHAISKSTFRENDVCTLRDKMRADHNYHPHITMETYSSPIFDVALPDIAMLPRNIIKPVVDFYHWDKVTHAAFADWRSDAVRNLDVQRRISLLNYARGLLDEHIQKAADAERELASHLPKK